MCIRDSLILQATKEVGGAVTSSTLTTIAVFAPLSFVSGIVGKFFVPFAVTVVVSILFSLIVALTVVPLMARLFLLKIEPHESKENGLQRFYRKSLDWSLNRRKTVISIALVLFMGSMALITIIPKNFLPQEKTDSYGLSVSLPVGTVMDRSNQLAQKIEGMLQSNSYVKNYQTYATGEEISIQIKLKDTVTKEDNQQFEQEMRKNLTGLDSDITTALTPQGLTSYGGGLFLVLNGTDIETLKKAGDQIVTAIKDTPGLTDVETNLSGGRPQISVAVDPVKAAEKGLNPAMVAMSVRQMIDGESVTTVNMNGRTTEINLSVDAGKLDSLDKIGEQLLTNMKGEKVKVSEVATISEKPGPTSIQRLNQQEYISVSGRFTTDNTSQVQKEVENKIKTLSLPKGVSYYFEGEAESLNEGFSNMTIAILAAILLVYMVMMIAFGEMIAPLAILFSLPFIFVGGLIGMFLFNQALGMPALVGFLMLIGIVVTNAIVLVDRVLQNRKKGLPLKEALIEAGVTRIRPILMTAVATIGALLPLAIFGEGGVISRSLAIVVISGLTTSTLLTLVIVPVAYYILDGVRNRFLNKKKNAAKEINSIELDF
jgi:HAE1 family hydrophobic/amphiphilic exporter-1